MARRYHPQQQQRTPVMVGRGGCSVKYVVLSIHDGSSQLIKQTALVEPSWLTLVVWVCIARLRCPPPLAWLGFVSQESPALGIVRTLMFFVVMRSYFVWK